MTDQIILNFELTLDEANAVLNALGAAPYNQVAGVIPKIHAQGEAQIIAWKEAHPEEAEPVKQPVQEELPE